MTSTRVPAHLAAIVNGALVLCSPFFLLLLLTTRVDDVSDTGTVVYASGTATRVPTLLGMWTDTLMVMAPLALVAACGFCLALIVLAPGIVFKPLEAPPYIIFYGGVALLAGTLVGFLLHGTALATLRMTRTARAATP